MGTRKRRAGKKPQTEMEDLLRREQEAIDDILKLYDAAHNKTEGCQECERFVADVLSAMLKIRALLFQRTEALDAGVIDDLGLLDSGDELNRAFAERQNLEEAYLRHTRQDHGSADG